MPSVLEPDHEITQPARPDGATDLEGDLAFHYRQRDQLFIFGQLATRMAHEIRNPLATLRGFTQMLQRPERQASAANYLAIMLREIDHLNAIVEDFVNAARPCPTEPTPCHPITLIENALRVLQTEAMRQSVTLRLEAADLDCAQILCDESRLTQALIHIVRQAIDASPPYESVVVSCNRDLAPAMLTIRIRDHGFLRPSTAIPTDSASRDWALTLTPSRAQDLWISESIIREQRGTLCFTPGDDGGCVAVLSLPIDGLGAAL